MIGLASNGVGSLPPSSLARHMDPEEATVRRPMRLSASIAAPRRANRGIFSCFEELVVTFIAFIHFALITEALRPRAV